MTRSWTVGGALRDELLGREVTDIDIAVDGDPEAAARELAEEVRGPVFRLSEAFGAWRVVDRAAAASTTSRRSRARRSRRTSRKRDFTINAMARPLGRRGADRPAGGQRGHRVARPPGDRPGVPTRAIRSARSGWRASRPSSASRPMRETERLTRGGRARVPEASGERVFAELRRLVLAPRAVEGLALADRLGLLHAVLPELADLHDVEQSHYHHKDVYGHTLEVLERLTELERRPPASSRRAGRAARRRAHARRRRSASARCSTTSASRPRTTCARTGA